MKNIVILISGTGSNMAAIVRAAQQDDWEARLQARVVAVDRVAGDELILDVGPQTAERLAAIMASAGTIERPNICAG